MTENQHDPIGQMQAAMKFFAEMQKPAQEAMKLFADAQMKFFADTQRPAQEAMKAFAELQTCARGDEKSLGMPTATALADCYRLSPLARG